MRSIPLLRRLSARQRIWLKDRTPGWIGSRLRPNAVRPIRRAGDAHRSDIPLFVLVCTWNEGDIIYASVRNAFDLGADRVFLLDNGSTDATVHEATSAGAELVLTFETERFDEHYKYELINGAIRQLSGAHAPASQVWWWMKDADEFLRAPESEGLRAFLARIDRRCRLVGARVLDHFPSPGVAYVPRTDPIDVQPLCREKVDTRCQMGHHKHPVFLWDPERRPIEVEPGFHQLRCYGEATFEPRESLVLHHHPFRNERDARERLEALRLRGSTERTTRATADAHMRSRLRSLDAVYRGDFDHVEEYQSGRLGVRLSDWRQVIEGSGSDV